MGMWILKGISLFGVIFIVVLMLRKQKQMAGSTEKDPVTGLTFNETWAKGMQTPYLYVSRLSCSSTSFRTWIFSHSYP